jgi:soluble lytic murein transglycosylase-like protein
MRTVLACVVGCGLVLGWASPARAELVLLANGRVLSVEFCRFEGDYVVLAFRNGGEVRAPKSLVAEILPDEVPHARAFALEALKMAEAASQPLLGDKEIRSLVDRIADELGLDRRLAQAVVKVESNYEQKAVSPRGAMGLMQIMPAVAQQYKVDDDPFDPAKNLAAGMKYLRSLLERFDRPMALAAYNAGEGAVSRYGGIPPYRETQDYVRRVLALLH